MYDLLMFVSCFLLVRLGAVSKALREYFVERERRANGYSLCFVPYYAPCVDDLQIAKAIEAVPLVDGYPFISTVDVTHTRVTDASLSCLVGSPHLRHLRVSDSYDC